MGSSIWSPVRSLTERVRLVEIAAVAGLAFAALYSVGLVLLFSQPDLEVSSREVDVWFAESGNRAKVIVGLNFAVFSAIAFLWFVAVIRRRMGEREDQFIATVFLGSALTFVAVMLVGTAALATTALVAATTDQDVDAGAVTLMSGFGSTLMFAVVPRLQAVFIVTTSVLGLRTGALARWVSLLGFVVAFLMLVVPLLIDALGMAFPAWVGLASVDMAVRRRFVASRVG